MVSTEVSKHIECFFDKVDNSPREKKVLFSLKYINSFIYPISTY